MIERAASFLVRNGPVTGEDRWEEDAGYSPFTLAVEIAALLAAADMLDTCGKGDAARYLRETADAWNEQVERWTYVTDTETMRAARGEGLLRPHRAPRSCRRGFAEGRLCSDQEPAARRDRSAGAGDRQPGCAGAGPLRPQGRRRSAHSRHRQSHRCRSCAATCRKGPSGIATMATAMASTPTARLSTGPARAGRGRCLWGNARITSWPRDASTRPKACWRPSRQVAGVGGLLPEQVWDGVDMPQRELRRGGPTGSAMPLVWAHSEHIKLLRSLRDGKVFDMPRQGVERYIQGKTGSSDQVMAFQQQDPVHAVRKDLARGTAGRRCRALEHRWMDDLQGQQDQPKRIRHSCCGPARRRYPAGWNHCLHLLLA